MAHTCSGNDPGFTVILPQQPLGWRGESAMDIHAMPVPGAKGLRNDAAIYALRNMVERCFNKLKNAPRLATRYDKTADSYLGFIHIASIRLWTRQFVNAS